MNTDAALILLALVGVLLVGAFSVNVGRDEDGSITFGRWLDLDRLGWRRGDVFATWMTRLGWVLIGVAAAIQFVRANRG